MKISARNQIAGKVIEVTEGQVNAVVAVEVGGNTIKSTITKSAVAEMGIKVGDSVYAIIKASNVIIATDVPNKISARNVIKANVVEVKNGEVNSQINLSAGSLKLASTITVDATKELGIKQNDEVFAIIKASNILIAKD